VEEYLDEVLGALPAKATSRREFAREDKTSSCGTAARRYVHIEELKTSSK